MLFQRQIIKLKKINYYKFRLKINYKTQFSILKNKIKKEHKK
jgi:hypothetical protein